MPLAANVPSSRAHQIIEALRFRRELRRDAKARTDMARTDILHPIKHAATRCSMRDERGRWLTGNSGNPAGRPRSGTAFAEAVRTKVDPDVLIERALKIAAGDNDSAALAAMTFLRDSGFPKPPSTTLIGQADADEQSFDHLSLERRRELLAELEGAPSTDEQVSLEPSLSDDESVKLG